MARCDPCDVLGRARRHHLTAAGAAFGTEVDDPVGRLDDIEVVLDDDHRVALLDEFAEHLEQLAHVFEVQPRGRLVEHVDAAPVRSALELRGELHSLGLAS